MMKAPDRNTTDYFRIVAMLHAAFDAGGTLTVSHAEFRSIYEGAAFFSQALEKRLVTLASRKAGAGVTLEITPAGLREIGKGKGSIFGLFASKLGF